MIDVSIVIVSFNTCKFLDECIQSIKQETAISYEIIVVDNASIDNTCQLLREKHPDVRLIENGNNSGFAMANNKGFALAQGRYFFMLNPDTVILDGAIDKLIDFMDRNRDVGICGPRNVGRDRHIKYSCDHYPSIWNTLWIYSNFVNRYPSVELFKKSGMRYWDYSEIRDVDMVSGSSLLIRSDLFKQLGGLDNDYFMYFEETDLCYRAIKSGTRVVYVPLSTIVHYGGESAQMQKEYRIINKTIISYFLSSQYHFYRKNYGFFPMFAIRSLDFIYGLSLLARNVLRKDKAMRDDNITKGKALCAGALRIC